MCSLSSLIECIIHNTFDGMCSHSLLIKRIIHHTFDQWSTSSRSRCCGSSTHASEGLMP
jgi:hypothetical protein